MVLFDARALSRWTGFHFEGLAAADLSLDRLHAATAHAHKLLVLLIGAKPTILRRRAR